jgi:Tfp pilus assembly protein PilV
VIPERVRRDIDGAALLEVVIAMLILAVGLLGLEALGITTSRVIARANLQSEYVQSATRHIEALSDSVRRAQIGCGTRSTAQGSRGDTVRVVVTGAINQRTVAVTIIPPASPGVVWADTFRLTRDLYVPNATAC